MSLPFAAIGLSHSHIYGQVDAVTAGGAELVSFYEEDDVLAETFAAAFPKAQRVADADQILGDESIRFIACAAVPSERAGLAVRTMRAGKDFFSDKPGMTTLEQLNEVRQVQRETGRLYSIFYSEHFKTRSTEKAGELVAAGRIGKVLNIVGLGPHRLDAPKRDPWFFDRERTGGILTDLASHQIEQFLFFSELVPGDTEGVRLVSALVANRAHPQTQGLQDFGEVLLRSGETTGYIRVDWFTPNGLPTWGDGRLLIMGTDGTIELRKYVDPAGLPGTDHLIVVDQSGVERIDCSEVELPFGARFVQDVLNRTETAQSQAHCFDAMELALKAQALAEASA